MSFSTLFVIANSKDAEVADMWEQNGIRIISILVFPDSWWRSFFGISKNIRLDVMLRIKSFGQVHEMESSPLKLSILSLTLGV